MKSPEKDETVRTLSVRISNDLYPAVSQIARRRKTSVNRLINEELAKLVDEELEQEMFASATLLGEDLEECDVEYAVTAQSEVALAND